MPSTTTTLALAVTLACTPGAAWAAGHIAVGDAEPGEGAGASVSTSGGGVTVRATSGGRSVSIDTSAVPSGPSVPDLPDPPTLPSLPSRD